MMFSIGALIESYPILSSNNQKLQTAQFSCQLEINTYVRLNMSLITFSNENVKRDKFSRVGL
jgi:hypothetical protein